MADIRKRRWFQFRLRTLLIAVMLLAIPSSYIAHEYRIVVARKEWLKDHPILHAVYYELPAAEPGSSLPIIRRLLGDELQDYVYLENPDEEKTAKELFPEAAVNVFTSAD